MHCSRKRPAYGVSIVLSFFIIFYIFVLSSFSHHNLQTSILMIKNEISCYSLFCENNRLTSRFDDVEMSEPINDRRKLEYKMKHFQQNLNRLKVENGASGKLSK